MTVTMFILCLLGVCSFQVVPVCGTHSSFSNEDKERININVSVAKALKALEQAGGSRKILENPLLKKGEPQVLEVFRSLVKMEEELKKKGQEEKIKPRFLSSWVKTGSQYVYQAFTNLILPAMVESTGSDSKPDPDMQL